VSVIPDVVTSVSPKLNSGFNVIEKPNGSYKLGIGVGVAVGGTGVAVGGTGVAVGGTGVVVGGTDVAAGGTDVAAGGTGVAVGGTDVAVGGTDVAVGGTDVAVGGTDVAVEGTAAADCVIVLATGGTVSVVEPPPHARMNSNINNPVKVIVSFVGEPIIMCHH
jgi:hypothetical protein